MDGSGAGLSVGGTTFLATRGRVGIGTSQPAVRLHMSSGGFILDGSAAAVVIGDSTFTVTSSGVGVGAAKPGSPLHVSSGVLLVDGAGASLTVASTLLYASAGRVGIGTSLQEMTLDVEGAAQFGQGAARSTITVSGDLQLVGGSTIASAGTLSLSTAASAALTGLPAVFVDRQGRVGIGVQNPGARLSVGGKLTGTAASPELAVLAGALGAPLGGVVRTASFGLTTGDSAALTAKGVRTGASAADWTTAAVGLELETDKALQSGASVWLSAGGVGIGTAAPASLLQVQNGDLVITDPAASRGVIFQDGSIQVTAAGNSQWFKVGDNIFTINSGNLGIGTTAPTYKLDVQGRIRFNRDALLNTVPPLVTARMDAGLASVVGDCPLFSSYAYWDSGASSWRYTSNSRAGFAWGACADVWNLYTSPASGGAGAGTAATLTPRLSVLPGGRVGIGTTAPAANLEILDSAGPSINLHRDGSSTWYVTASAVGSNRLGLRSGANLDASEKLTLTASGLLGVGTTAPINRLDVKGNMAAGTFAGTAAAPVDSLIVSSSAGIGSASPGAALEIVDSGSTGLRYVRTDARDARISVGDPFRTWSAAVGWAVANEFSFIEEGSAGDRLYIDAAGLVGLGTSNPQNKLDVAGAVGIGSYAGIAAPTNSLLVSGKVGIGVTDPGYPLEVLGELRVTDSAGTNHLYSQGRPGAVRYGLTGESAGLCTNGSFTFGLSKARVKWEGASAACPSGTWVCTQTERGVAACDTARPDSPTCDYRSGSTSIACTNQPPDQHWGHVADNTFQSGREGNHVNENGSAGGGGGGQYEMPVWCCN